ncbi:MAG: serine hydroxymethyltransferase, partial [Bacteroidetes bacterium]|nr:serine hydroxymethyltransferase [Bacteroidota bacterium]
MTLKKTDPQIAKFISQEIRRQKQGLELIPSENFVSSAVLTALGSPLTNKYSEGYPGKRYYGGNQYIDQIETLAIERAQKLFKAQHVNIQPYSGSPANLEVYFALLKPG